MISRHMNSKLPMEKPVQVQMGSTLQTTSTYTVKQSLHVEMEDGTTDDDGSYVSSESSFENADVSSITAKLTLLIEASRLQDSSMTSSFTNEKIKKPKQKRKIQYDDIRPIKKLKPIVFLQWADYEMQDIVYEFLVNGIDKEDIQYFKSAHEHLIYSGSFHWLKSIHWSDQHPQTQIKELPFPAEKRSRKKKDTMPMSEEGSIRTRGFLRMTKEEKTRALSGQQQPELIALGSGKVNGGVGKCRETQSREARSHQRRLLTELGTESDLLKFNQLHFRKKALKLARSKIHEWGLFAAEPIAAEEMVTEYVGQVIRSWVADLRERTYETQGIGSSYLFRIDEDTVIDATRWGNLSRFINHSCNPNCYAKVITIGGEKKVVFYSKQSIAISEELTYDYRFPIEDKKIPCLCGTVGCRGTLN
ncbi:unnamed protein product [Orchesella dallaii]|uniref:[histone H3]-lysine(4) N-trimethyltransferase n=1 Tax=Orchesella dallaii TaxID=48710 RepID=A0ABP1RX05_9HEXA